MIDYWPVGQYALVFQICLQTHPRYAPAYLDIGYWWIKTSSDRWQQQILRKTQILDIKLTNNALPSSLLGMSTPLMKMGSACIHRIIMLSKG